MSKTLSIKIITLLAIALALLIPITMVKSKVVERQQYRNDAVSEIKESRTGEQTLITPILVITYTLDHSVLRSGEFNRHHQAETQHTTILADMLTGNINTKNSELQKGIYHIPIYQVDIQLQGTFSHASIERALEEIRQQPGFSAFENAYLTFHTSDNRGIQSPPLLKVNGNNLPIISSSPLPFLSTGLHSLLNNMDQYKEDVNYDLNMQLSGMEQFSLTPMALQADISLQSNWPHPNFTGASLPVQRTIRSDGFSARWNSTDLAGQYGSALDQCNKSFTHCNNLSTLSYGVRFIEPVDIYLKSERAIKYAMLFIGLGFCVFFLFEVIREIRIHPIQYAFVGMSFAVFYLLLLSLSEHIDFSWAYGISVLACCSLLMLYLRHVLYRFSAALIFSGALACLYSVLFVILQAEDMAQLMGTILVFAILAALMISTRKFDWYNITNFDR